MISSCETFLKTQPWLIILIELQKFDYITEIVQNHSLLPEKYFTQKLPV